MTLRRWLLSAAVVVATLLAASTGTAQERIVDFASDVAVNADGSMLVVETIVVQVEGKRFQRGILREFPTHYEDRRGVKVVVPFEVIDVQRDGAAEPYQVESLANGVRVRIGRREVLLPHGRHTYRIAYRTTRQLGFFERHDELYWNVTGNGWPFDIDRVSAQIRLPRAVAAGELKAEAFTGPQGARGRNATATVSDGEFQFETTRALGPNEGLTIVAAFPKGVVAAPSLLARLAALIKDNGGAVLGIGSLAAILSLLFLAWWHFGRDPRKGPAFPRYDPPPNLSAAAVRFVDQMGFDARCLAAGVLGLGARGYLKVAQSGDGFLVRTTGQSVPWLPGDKPLAESLFQGRREAVLGRTYDAAVAAASQSLRAALRRHYKGVMFRSNGWPIWLTVLLGASSIGAAASFGAHPILVVVLAAVLLVAVMIFGRLMPAYTREGRALQDHIDGLRQYLGVAERDDLARMQVPEMTPAEFARMLPYALALDVEKTWADRFAAVLGSAAVAAAAAAYYSGDSDTFGGGASGLADSLGALDSTVSAAATPPGSESGGSDSGGSGGSGGGGSSGGGGGGGGGGGW